MLLFCNPGQGVLWNNFQFKIIRISVVHQWIFLTVTIFPPPWYQIQLPTLNRSKGWPLLLLEFDSLVSRLIWRSIADPLKEVTARGLDVAAMLLSRTNKLLAGLQQPASKYLSTAPALYINKHPDVIRGKVLSHTSDQLPFLGILFQSPLLVGWLQGLTLARQVWGTTKE